MYRPEQDPWELLQNAISRINILEKYHNELGIAHNNLVSNTKRLEDELNIALESIQVLQLSQIKILDYLEIK